MELDEVIREAQVEFDSLTKVRMVRGAEKYGANKFLAVDTLEEALFELADLSNYAMMTFIRIRVIQAQLQATLGTQVGDNLLKDKEV